MPFWYVPAVHCEQGPAAGPEKPILQVQAVEVMLPGGESEFEGHSRHSTGRRHCDKPGKTTPPPPQSSHRPSDIFMTVLVSKSGRPGLQLEYTAVSPASQYHAIPVAFLAMPI